MVYLDMNKGFYLKNLDEKAYRAIKSIAAKRGVPVYRVINEALALYANLYDSLAAETEEEANNRVYEALVGDPRYTGKWVVIARGKLISVVESWNEAVKVLRNFLKREKASHGIISKVGVEVEEIEILGSSLEML